MPSFANFPNAEAPAPAAAAAVRAALQDELATRAFYHASQLMFGATAPWPQLVQANAQRITALVQQAQRLRMRLPAPPPPGAIQPAPAWLPNLERGLHGAMISASRYQQLIATTPDPAIRTLFQRFQNELLTQHIPALQRAWQAAADRERYHAMQGIDPSEAYASHGLIGDTVEQLLALLTRQGGVFGLAGTLLRAAHPALVAGALTGSAAVQGVRLRKLLTPASKTYTQED